MADRDAGGSSGVGGTPRDMLANIAEQRHSAATASVETLRAAHPDEGTEQLGRRLIRQCARDLAVAGAMSGGAAASPAAGPAGAATLLGAEGALNAARLGEMVMAIGILHGHTDAPSNDRALWLAAALGASEGTALGLTGMAARAGVRGGSRLLGRIPSGAAASGAGRLGRTAAKMSARRGPWGLAVLLPYTLGASMGAAGNLALAMSIGRAAMKYFSSGEASDPTEGSEAESKHAAEPDDEELWDVEVVSERILDED